MRAINFVKKSPLFSDREKHILINRVLHQIRGLVQSELNQSRASFYSTCSDNLLEEKNGDSMPIPDFPDDHNGCPDDHNGPAPVSRSPTWQYSSFSPRRNGSKTLHFWRNEIQNFLYDINFESLDMDKDGSIFGIQYKKKSLLRDALPIADEPYNEAARLLPYIADYFRMVPLNTLPTQLVLGQGVMAQFRPPRDSRHSIQVFAAPSSSPLSSSYPGTSGREYNACHTNNPSKQSVESIRTAPQLSSLPPFEYRDFQLYSTTRNRIEANFSAFESFLKGGIHHMICTVREAKDTFITSKVVETVRAMRDAIAAGRDVRLHDCDLQNINHMDSFWDSTHISNLESSARKNVAGRLEEDSIEAGLSSEEEHDVLVLVRYRFLDQSFIRLRHLRQLPLHYLPLVIPNPNPAASRSTFSALRLARAEFVLFSTVIVLGAAPALYRGINFSFDHPMLAQMVAASMLSTVAYTAWSSRRKIEMSLKLMIEEATLARVVSQDCQTLSFVQEKYVDVCADTLLLLYAVRLSKQRAKYVDEREGDCAAVTDSGVAENENRGWVTRNKAFIEDYCRDCEEMSLAQSGGGEGSLMTPALRRKVESMLLEWGLETREGDGAGGEGGVCEIDRVEDILARRFSHN